jgi:hypothetical protein
MVHELAHQWYGDSVAPETWSDLWLNEGHATWYEWTYGDEFFGGDFEFVARIRGAYEQGDQWCARYGPAASHGGRTCGDGPEPERSAGRGARDPQALSCGNPEASHR